ncbi:zinc-dependent alcohol dehydrogenase [Catenulispora subtropica]|uniref:Alcohol dehydrogenase GroES domain protein n=1 Tax=Catenulispora subtropica TaxID=450798 RepID=A0ABN2T3I6_9ACTN
MRALVFTGPGQMELRDEPLPEPGADEVLVTVEASGICGSELHGFRSVGMRKPPLIMGHEFAGRTPDDTRVVVNPLHTCGRCPACRAGRTPVCRNRQLLGVHRAGGFAEQVAVPAGSLHALPDGLDWTAAALIEPLANAVHAWRLAAPGPAGRAATAEAAATASTAATAGTAGAGGGSGAAVAGAAIAPVTPASAALPSASTVSAASAPPPPQPTGPIAILGAGAIGLVCLLVARHRGATDVVVADPSPQRRAIAEALGAETVADLTSYGPASGFDIVFDAVGVPATRAASLERLAPAGTALWLGLAAAEATVDGNDIVRSEKRVLGSFAYSDADFSEAVALAASVDLDWATPVPMSRAHTTFMELAGGRTDIIKAVLRREED